MWIVVLSTPVFLYLLFIFRYYPSLQFQMLTLAAIIYIVLAVAHHLKKKNLTLGIVIEYVLIASLALIALQSLLI